MLRVASRSVGTLGNLRKINPTPLVGFLLFEKRLIWLEFGWDLVHIDVGIIFSGWDLDGVWYIYLYRD